MEASAVIDPTVLKDGVVAAKAGDLARARALLTLVTEAEPGNEVAWLWLASVSETPGQAVSCWRKVLAINPNQKHAREGLKRVLVQEGISVARAGNKAQARLFLEEAAVFDPANELIWFWLASVAATTDEALRCINQVLEINPDNQRAGEWLQKLQPRTATCPVCQAVTGNNAVRCLSCKAVLSFDDLNLLLNNKEANSQHLQHLIAGYEASLEQQANFAAFYGIGLAYLNLGQHSEGVIRLQQASKIKPDDKSLREVIARLMCWPQAGKSVPEVEKPATNVNVKSAVVLVVDDSPTIRKLVSVTLERQGYRVILADGGMEALKRLNEVVPDLILLDITMPQMDGYQLCRLIKGNEMTSKVPVVMLSGKDGFFDKVRGKMVGASEYLTKPFEPAALIQTVGSHCNV